MKLCISKGKKYNNMSKWSPSEMERSYKILLTADSVSSSLFMRNTNGKHTSLPRPQAWGSYWLKILAILMKKSNNNIY